MKNAAKTFIREKLNQQLKKPAPKKGSAAAPVGIETESALRDALNDELKQLGVKFEASYPRHPLLLKENEFKKTKPVNSDKKLKLSAVWDQCDLFYKGGKSPILGEIKTTTSAIHNVCGLINKNITAYRELKSEPLSVVMYPDSKVATLRRNHADVVTGLYEYGIISESEYKKLEECFFILTNIRYKGDIRERIAAMSGAEAEQALRNGNLIELSGLMRTDDLNYEEWERLLNYIANVVK